MVSLVDRWVYWNGFVDELVDRWVDCKQVLG